tara:strand:+ start:355 stop:621 length:267 start_codon:yes stop_codon:yes gene_type:complete
METKREDMILIANFCNKSPHGWLPNYDIDWNALMEAIEAIEYHTKVMFTIPRSRGKYSIEKTYYKVLTAIVQLDIKTMKDKVKYGWNE